MISLNSLAIISGKPLGISGFLGSSIPGVVIYKGMINFMCFL